MQKQRRTYSRARQRAESELTFRTKNAPAIDRFQVKPRARRTRGERAADARANQFSGRTPARGYVCMYVRVYIGVYIYIGVHRERRCIFNPAVESERGEENPGVGRQLCAFPANGGGRSRLQ